MQVKHDLRQFHDLFADARPPGGADIGHRAMKCRNSRDAVEANFLRVKGRQLAPLYLHSLCAFRQIRFPSDL
jgi:hypothetical protein